MSVTRAALAAALCLATSACVPYAYVLPPLDIGADVGARVDSSTQAQVTVNVATRPLALVSSLHHRWVDFAIGYSLMVLPAPLLHGPSAELTHLFVEIQTSESFLWRLRGGLVSRFLFSTAAQGVGTQVNARVVFEGLDFVDRDVTSSNRSGVNVGHALGEGGFGLYTETGVLVLPSAAAAWTVSTGLMFTLPAGAGVGFAWLR